MPRLLFEKKGNAVWISHLDLMRLFQRAFKRAGLPLKHSQGFSPRPYVAVALPLSVGVESCCELLDFDLEGETSLEGVADKLNAALVEGVRVLDVYENGRKIKDLALLDCVVTLEYDRGIDMAGVEQIRGLFARESLPVEKKGKNGVTEQDIIPMIRKLEVDLADGHTVEISARVCCQNPSLNPMQLGAAVVRYLPELAPDHIRSRRVEIFDKDEKQYR